MRAAFGVLLSLWTVALAFVLPRQIQLTCLPTDMLVCCGSLNLASTPIISNTLGLLNLPIPAPYVTVGLNCSPPASPTAPLQAECLGIFACCVDAGIGINGDIAENCNITTISPPKKI